MLFHGARWSLVKNNYGALNGARGSLLVNHGDASDNLFLGNRLDPSAPTVRQGEWDFHYGISTYGTGGSRNHLVDNVMNDVLSFRTKFMAKEMIIQGNTMLGSCSTVPVTYFEIKYKPADRIVFRNNVMLSTVATDMQPMPPCGPGGNWCDSFKAFVNNFAPAEKDRPAAIPAARFAAPAYLDYRLQADSPLRGSGLGGVDVGAYPQSHARIFYVSVTGRDDNAGTSDQRPLGTLAKAAGGLGPGDTLYVLPGVYAEPLFVANSGTEAKPITIRARNPGEVTLRSVVVRGSWVVLEGFVVSAAASDGVVVAGHNVRLQDCLVHGCAGCGIKASGTALAVRHCTLAANGTGLASDPGCADAVLRDSIVAGNRGAAVAPASNGPTILLSSHNCYWGGGLEPRRIQEEIGSTIADPKFVDPAHGDFRLAWDSPAAHRAAFGRAAGARPALVRTPEIEQVQVAAARDRSAVITWRTPKDDSTGVFSWRRKGRTAWNTLPRTELGTVHGVGLVNLQPRTEYEFRIGLTSRRGGTVESRVCSLTTSDRPHDPVTYHVSPSGDDRADGRTPQTAWKTLRRASFAAAAGDTVLIAPGSSPARARRAASAGFRPDQRGDPHVHLRHRPLWLSGASRDCEIGQHGPG